MPVESLPRFQQLQREMTDWLREPAHKPAPDVEPRRLAIYRELFFNNVRDFVENAYPTLKSLLPEAQWSALVADFFAEHRCQSPYFRDISLEFRQWMELARADLLDEHPWMQELLHYEWVELAAECAEVDEDVAAVDRDGDLLDGMPVVVAAAWPLVYRWPVHTFAPGEPPSDATGAVEAAYWRGRLTDPPAAAGQTVLLVVDATTSGWPITIAAAALREAGATAVLPLLIHRTVG